MTLSLADIEAWDEAAIEQVFLRDAACEGAQATGNTVGDLLTSSTGMARRPSGPRVGQRIKVTLNDHSEECNG